MKTKNKIKQRKNQDMIKLTSKNKGGRKHHYRYILFILLIVVNLSSCSKKTSNNHSDQSLCNMSIDSFKVKEVLHIQLKDGTMSGYGGRFGLNALFSVADTIIQNSGYKKPTVEAMKEKIKNIFGYYPPDVDSLISYIPRFSEPSLNCDGTPIDFINKDISRYDNSVYSLLYLSYEHRLITPAYYLPEILDYKKQFPELVELEQESTWEDNEFWEGFWKEYFDLEERQKENRDYIIHLNKYIFNDSRSSLTWLINNYNNFAHLLVKRYGYDKDPRINQIVLEDINKEYLSVQSTENKVLENLFAAKDYYNKLQIREGLMKYIVENTTVEHSELLDRLINYAGYIKDQSPKESEFTPAERYKIMAYAGYYEQLTRNKNNIDDPNSPDWVPPGWHYDSFLKRTIDINSEFLKEIKKNDYYGLSGLEDMIESLL